MRFDEPVAHTVKGRGIGFWFAVSHRSVPSASPLRRGAILSYELVFIFPIAIAFLLAMIEFGLIWSAAHKVHLATQNACRVGTRPCPDLLELDQAVRLAAEESLIDRRLIASQQLKFQPGAHTGDPVVVELTVPMSAASPDMLSIIGYSLQGRFLTSRVVMSKE